MKKNLALFLMLLALTIQAQNNIEKKDKEEEDDDKKEVVDIDKEARFFNSFVSTNTFSEFTQTGSPGGNDAFTVVKPKIEIQGNKFLTKKWDNRATIRTLSGKQITVSNVNYELEEGTFALQGSESIFLIDGSKYNEIIFNGTSFKHLYNPLSKQNRYYEVVGGNDDFTLIKDNYLAVRESGANNPGYGQKIEKAYVAKTRYYIMKKDSFKEFVPKKSTVLSLLSNSDQVATYAKKNKLSYRKSEDLKRIFDYNQGL